MRFLFSFLFILLFAGVVSAGSLLTSQGITNECISPNLQYLEYNLSEYWDFDLTDDLYILYRDPINGNPLALSVGYATLNDYCFEMAYFFQNGEDWLRIESLDDICDFDLIVRMCPLGDCNTTIDDNFNVEVSNDCDNNPSVPVNGSLGLYDDLISYYRFDETSGTLAYDSHSNNDATISGIQFNVTGGLFGGSYLYDDLTDSVDLGSTSDFAFSPTDDFTFSGWFLFDNETYTNNPAFFSRRISPSGGLYGVELSGLGSVGYIVFNAVGSGSSYDNNWNYTVDPTMNQLTHVVLTFDGTSDARLYINGVLQTENGDTGSYTGNINLTNSFTVGRQEGLSTTGWSGVIDEVAIWNRVLTSSDVSDLYNNGNGVSYVSLGRPSSGSNVTSSIPDVEMGGNETYWYNVSQHFYNWTDIYIDALDPINTNVRLPIYTGYATLWTDYYEVQMYANGTMKLTSYDRPYNVTLPVYACNYLGGDEVCVSDVFELRVDANLSDVVQLNPFFASYSLDLNLSDYEWFSMNYYFQYYDGVRFSIPESNFSGNLNESYDYEVNPNPLHGGSYILNLNCSLGGNYTEYNYLGDNNYSLRCGTYNIEMWIYPYNNYNNTIDVYAYNDHSQESDYFLFLSGNPELLPGELFANFTQNQSTYLNITGAIDDIFPSRSSLNKQGRWFVMFVVFAGIFMGLFILFGSITSIMIYVYLVFLNVLFYFFAGIDYIQLSVPILMSIFLMLFGAIKFFRGGS